MERKTTFSFMTDVADSLTTFHFHTTSLDTAMLSKQSKKPTAIVCVESAPLRVLTPQLSVKGKIIHNLKQMVLNLPEKSINISILIMAITAITTVITMVFILVALAVGTITDMVITTDTTTVELTVDKAKPSMMSGCRNTSITQAQIRCSMQCS